MKLRPVTPEEPERQAHYKKHNPMVVMSFPDRGGPPLKTRTSPRRERILLNAYAEYMGGIMAKVLHVEDALSAAEQDGVAGRRVIAFTQNEINDWYSVNGLRGIVECLAYACMVVNIELVGKKNRKMWRVPQILEFLVAGHGGFPVARDFPQDVEGAKPIPVPQNLGNGGGVGEGGTLGIRDMAYFYDVANTFQHEHRPFTKSEEPNKEHVSLLRDAIAKTKALLMKHMVRCVCDERYDESFSWWAVELDFATQQMTLGWIREAWQDDD